MEQILVTIAPDLNKTRLLVSRQGQDVVKAILPAATIAHPLAAKTLLEGLALWYQQRLCVVLCVDEQQHCCDTMQLYDTLGNGVRQLHFEVAVVGRERQRRNRLSGVGDFSDLRAIDVWGQL
jgi:hypothetical protein